jgi:hypothetical protein
MPGRRGFRMAAKRAGPQFFSVTAFYIPMRNPTAKRLTRNKFFFRVMRVGESLWGNKS